MVGMRRCGRCSSLLRFDFSGVAVAFLVLCVFSCGEAWVAYPKRLTSLRDEWRLIGVPHPSFYWRAIKRGHFALEIFRTTTCGLGEADAAPFVAKRCKPRLPPPTRIPRGQKKGPPVQNEKPLSTTFGLRSHRKRYELRPRTDTSLSRGGLTDRLLHEVPQLYRFFPK